MDSKKHSRLPRNQRAGSTPDLQRSNKFTSSMKELVIIMDKDGESDIFADDNAVHVRMDTVDKRLGRTVSVLEREKM